MKTPKKMQKIITTKISTWGNSFGIRLPRDFVLDGKIAPNQPLEVSLGAEGRSFLVKPKSSRQPISKEWFANALKNMAEPGAEDTRELDWGKPVGREVW